MRERETENRWEQKRKEVDELVKKGFEKLVG